MTLKSAVSETVFQQVAHTLLNRHLTDAADRSAASIISSASQAAAEEADMEDNELGDEEADTRGSERRRRSGR
jgi:hypothetical protein